ncbi:hypothetical protein QYF61_003773 [Mycteria americana]|uniref:Uncharacterized protein n=1 Tax=Mycteria americana TaxID=33587 RepID=A0AAN7NEE8_MYCAM|nr:hypothetical protein QYF61_003773 [Mycteria americana]
MLPNSFPSKPNCFSNSGYQLQITIPAACVPMYLKMRKGLLSRLKGCPGVVRNIVPIELELLQLELVPKVGLCLLLQQLEHHSTQEEVKEIPQYQQRSPADLPVVYGCNEPKRQLSHGLTSSIEHIGYNPFGEVRHRIQLIPAACLERKRALMEETLTDTELVKLPNTPTGHGQKKEVCSTLNYRSLEFSTVAAPGTEKDVLVCGCLLLVFTMPAPKWISTSARERSLTLSADFVSTSFRPRNFLGLSQMSKSRRQK